MVGPSTPSTWYMYPNGNWSVCFGAESEHIYQSTIQFSVDWSMNSVKTTRLKDGTSKLIRECQGVLVCSREGCSGVVRPRSTPILLQEQIIEQLCPIVSCGRPLRHLQCKARCTILTHGDKTRTFEHSGFHLHRPPRNLHLTPEQLAAFKTKVLAAPKLTPVQLITGTSLDGPGQPVTAIDPSLNNIDKVAHLRRAALSGSDQPPRGGDKFVESIAAFERKNPGFITFLRFAPTVLIMFQTEFMASLMVKEVRSDARNGHTTDAHHSFFHGDKKYLIVTATFSTDLNAWVPVMYAYAGGQSEEDYRAYFFVLLETMHKKLGTKVDITDEDLAQVCIC